MASKHEEQVAGVTLWFKHSSLAKPQADERFRVNLTLDCSVKDEELWRVVETKFKDGFRVFTSEDFHIGVMDVMRSDIKTLESKLRESEKKLAQEADRSKQLEEELKKYKEPLQAFGQALGGGGRTW